DQPESKKRRYESGLLVFGRSASFEHGLTPKLEVGPILSQIDESYTDIARTLELAAASFDAGAEKRIVLLTDGRENIGSAEEVARRLAQRGVSIDTVPIGRKQGDEVLAQKVILPARAERQETFAIKCVVESTVEKDAVLKLYRNNTYLGQQDVHLIPGRNVYSFNQTEPQKGFYTYSFEIDTPNDSVSENNRARNFTFVEGQPRLLYLTGDPNESPDLAAMLAPKQIDLEFHQIGYMPQDLADLLTYDGVFFSDVSAERLLPSQQDMIKSYVQGLGKGFVMLGGENSYGVGGWYKSTVEEVLPVTMDFKRQQHFPSTGLAIVIDRSGSMGEMAGGYTKLDLAKKAALESGLLLTPRDYIGVIQFDDQGYWVTDKMQKAASKNKLRAQVGSITIGGGTNIYAGLKPAVDALEDLNAQVKHIILLTDGMSAPGDFEGLTRECKSHDITLTTVATGPDSNVAFLESMAKATDGRFYPLNDARNLSRIFTKETFLAATKSVIEDPFYPNAGEAHPITDGFPFGNSRALLGYNATTKKDLATVSMTAKSGEPLLAHWNYGLGKSIAWTSDAKNRWAAAWMGWGPGQGMWTQAIRWLVGEQESNELIANISREGTSTTVTVDSFTTSGDLDASGDLTAHVISPDLQDHVIPMRQVSPGRFELADESTL
ncbi:MAG: VWA domain-containing protein, partial [bacterium]